MTQEGAHVKHRKPREVQCDWCKEPSRKAIPLRRHPGQFMYACPAHLEVAHRANQPKERK